ncbi:MAG: phage tail spike protein [Bacillota bacterium]
MAELYVFDRDDNLLTVLSTDAKGTCTFHSAPFEEELNREPKFQFIAPADHPDAKFVKEENQVAFLDKDDNFRLFIIKNSEFTNGEGGPEILAECVSWLQELDEEPIEEIRAYDTTLKDAMTRALANTRVNVGSVAELGINSANFYYITVKKAIEIGINTWGGELQDRIEIDGNKIAGRYIEILSRRGSDTGKRWEIDKDIDSLNYRIESNPKTALYGRGSSIETDGGGFTRKITFADVEWKVVNGDPVDKPLGQEWVGDPQALLEYGRKNEDESRRHRFGFFDDGEQKDAAQLLSDTWDALQFQKAAFLNVEMDVYLLEQISGYEHERARLGDTTIAIDDSFSRPIELESRIIRFAYDISDPENTGEVELGNFIDLYDRDLEVEEIKEKLNDREGIWNNPQIGDANFPDTVPPTPSNFKIKGLIKTIKLDWDFEPESYIREYEVYASQVAGFTVDPTNLVFKGKTGGYLFQADYDQQWYFRIRAVNTHGTPSILSVELSAQTQRVGKVDYEDLSITNAKIADVSADKMTVGTLDANLVNVTNLNADNIVTGVLQGINIIQDDGAGGKIEMINGEFITYQNNKKILSADSKGLKFYDEGTGNELGYIRDEQGGGGTEKGIGIVGTKDFIALGFEDTGDVSKRWMYFDYDNTQTSLYGSNHATSAEGRLFLKSTSIGGDSNGLVPAVTLNNFIDPVTRWSSVVVNTGRNNNAPGGSNERFGFEVWQYTGDGQGGNKQMLKIDTSGTESFTSILTDKAYLSPTVIQSDNGNYKWALTSVISQNLENIHGAQNSTTTIYADEMRITINAGQYRTSKGYNFSGAENIFLVIAQPYSANAFAFNARIYSQSSTGFTVYLTRNTEAEVTSSFTIRVRFIIFYES